jgi:4'-phosphopantetheinyl transferase
MNMVEIFAVNIKEEISKGQIIRFVNSISNEKRKRIARFHFNEDFLRSLYGEIIVRLQIIKKIGSSNQCICFKNNEYGKPFVEGIADFEFNISHAGDWVVCAIGEKSVGIDIEKIMDINMDIAENFFACEECEVLMEKTEEQKNGYFFDLWTLKESYIKWAGKGLSIPLNSFCFIKKGEEFIIDSGKQENIKFRQYDIEEGYKLAVCSEEESVEEVKIIRLKDIRKEDYSW